MILYILPSGWLRWLVGRVTGFGRKPTPRIKKKVEIQKEAEDEEMLGVTMGFLQSRFGVEEAL